MIEFLKGLLKGRKPQKPLSLHEDFGEMLAPRKRKRKMVRPIIRKRSRYCDSLTTREIGRQIDNLSFRLGVGT